MTPKKRLIEVALPLDAINKASAREKSIRHGHPSTLHLWWARRPLAAARAVISAQMVDDPSAYVDVLRGDAKLRRKAEAVLKARKKVWGEAIREGGLLFARGCLVQCGLGTVGSDCSATGQADPARGWLPAFVGGRLRSGPTLKGRSNG